MTAIAATGANEGAPQPSELDSCACQPPSWPTVPAGRSRSGGGHRGRDLGGVASTLIEAAREVGLDAHAARDYLEGDQGFDEVSESVASLHRAGVSSIPVFIFKSGGFSETVHGSADKTRFSRVFHAIRDHWQQQQSETCADG